MQLMRLWRSFAPRRQRQLVLLALLMILSSFTEVVSIGAIMPFLAVLTNPLMVLEHPKLQPLIIWMGITEVNDLVLLLALTFSLAAIVAGFMRLLLFYTTTRLTYSIGADLGYHLYQRTLYQPYAVHVSRNSSAIINSILSKVSGVAYGVVLSSLNILTASAMLISVLTTLIIIDPIIAIMSILGFSSIYGIIITFTKLRLRAQSQYIANESNRVVKVLQEGLGGIRDVIIDGTYNIYCQNFHRADLLLKKSIGINQFIAAAPRFILEALGMSLIAGIAYFLFFSGNGIVSAIPVLGALGLGMQRLLPVIHQGYAAYVSMKGQQDSLADVLDLLNQPLPEYLKLNEIEPITFEKAIELEGVSFKYKPELPLVLDNINLTISKRSRLGIIGATGGGKSTFVDLLMGLLEPTGGKLIIDGVSISDKNCHAWMRHIAHVPQTIYLSDSSIAENIAFGIEKNEIDMGRVQQAARHAQISEVIEGWTNKYETIVGERGVRLSGGQRQRIGIARALYKQAEVIVFDEATSALDNETEKAVMESIEGLSEDLTIIIIAHRLTTLKDCDQIIELSGCRIKRIGTYQEIVDQAVLAPKKKKDSNLL